MQMPWARSQPKRAGKHWHSWNSKQNLAGRAPAPSSPPSVQLCGSAVPWPLQPPCSLPPPALIPSPSVPCRYRPGSKARLGAGLQLLLGKENQEDVSSGKPLGVIPLGWERAEAGSWLLQGPQPVCHCPPSRGSVQKVGGKQENTQTQRAGGGQEPVAWVPSAGLPLQVLAPALGRRGGRCWGGTGAAPVLGTRGCHRPRHRGAQAGQRQGSRRRMPGCGGMAGPAAPAGSPRPRTLALASALPCTLTRTPCPTRPRV